MTDDKNSDVPTFEGVYHDPFLDFASMIFYDTSVPVPNIQPEKVSAVIVPPEEQPSLKLSLTSRRFLFLWIGIIVLGLLGGLGVLNYFGTIQLASLHPALSFLPTREEKVIPPEKIILARIGETVVTQKDADNVKRIQNGIAEYQQIAKLTDEQAKDVAIRQGKVIEEARTRGIDVNQDEVNNEIARLEKQGGKQQAETLLLAYHITRDDWAWLVQGRLLQQKLEQALVSSIDAQIFSLRFDAKLAARDIPVQTLQEEARPLLTQTIGQLRDTPYATVAAAFIQQYADHPRLDPKTTPAADTPSGVITVLQKDATDADEKTALYPVLSALPLGGSSDVICTPSHCWIGKVVAKRGSVNSLEDLIGGSLPW